MYHQPLSQNRLHTMRFFLTVLTLLCAILPSLSAVYHTSRPCRPTRHLFTDLVDDYEPISIFGSTTAKRLRESSRVYKEHADSRGIAYMSDSDTGGVAEIGMEELERKMYNAGESPFLPLFRFSILRTSFPHIRPCLGAPDCCKDYEYVRLYSPVSGPG